MEVSLRIALLLISMCLPGFAQIHIYLKFDVPPAEAVLVAMKSQVEVLYRQTEIRFFWMEDGDYREVPGQVLLLQFHGSCSGAGYKLRNEGLPLGWTFKEHGGEVLPFIGLNCDLTRGITGQQEDNIFGRALG